MLSSVHNDKNIIMSLLFYVLSHKVLAYTVTDARPRFKSIIYLLYFFIPFIFLYLLYFFTSKFMLRSSVRKGVAYGHGSNTGLADNVRVRVSVS